PLNSWAYSPDYGQACKVVDRQTIWGQTVYRVWLPGRDAIVRLSAARLRPLESMGVQNEYAISYVAAAARIADALTQDVLLAPLEARVVPLPHQLRALSKALSGERVRYLLADEVGLGKTIEAGLIM